MSQSDYIKFKKISTQLSVDNSTAQNNVINSQNAPVLESQNYTDFVEYALENKIANTKIIYHQITPPGKRIVMDMEKTITHCPSFIVCNGTNTRPNRRPMSQGYNNATPIPLSIKKTKNVSNQKNGCICAQNSAKYTNSCKCAIANWTR